MDVCLTPLTINAIQVIMRSGHTCSTSTSTSPRRVGASCANNGAGMVSVDSSLLSTTSTIGYWSVAQVLCSHNVTRQPSQQPPASISRNFWQHSYSLQIGLGWSDKLSKHTLSSQDI